MYWKSIWRLNILLWDRTGVFFLLFFGGFHFYGQIKATSSFVPTAFPLHCCNSQTWRRYSCRRWYILGWVFNVKSWPIISAITKFTAFGPTFAIKIVSEPQKKFSTPWVCVWRNGFSIVGSKIKVVVESSVTYQNLSVEKCKTNGKRISPIRPT